MADPNEVELQPDEIAICDPQQKNLEETVTNFLDDTAVEQTPSFDPICSSNSKDDDTSTDEVGTLQPTFNFVRPIRNPLNILRKGRSKSNLSKGKHVCSQIPDFTIEADPLEEPCTRIKIAKRFADLAEESYHIEKLERIKITLTARIEKLVHLNLITLSDVMAMFFEEAIPISSRLPAGLQKGTLSNLLLANSGSTFVQTINQSINLQDKMRKDILSAKNLPVCNCGYIYVHPSLTFATHADNKLTVMGKISQTEFAVEVKEDVLKKLDALRFFLEVVSEYHTKKK